MQLLLREHLCQVFHQLLDRINSRLEFGGLEQLLDHKAVLPELVGLLWSQGTWCPFSAPIGHLAAELLVGIESVGSWVLGRGAQWTCISQTCSEQRAQRRTHPTKQI